MERCFHAAASSAPAVVDAETTIASTSSRPITAAAAAVWNERTTNGVACASVSLPPSRRSSSPYAVGGSPCHWQLAVERRVRARVRACVRGARPPSPSLAARRSTQRTHARAVHWASAPARVLVELRQCRKKNCDIYSFTR
jgi:hypothetical protein